MGGWIWLAAAGALLYMSSRRADARTGAADVVRSYDNGVEILDIAQMTVDVPGEDTSSGVMFLFRVDGKCYIPDGAIEGGTVAQTLADFDADPDVLAALVPDFAYWLPTCVNTLEDAYDVVATLMPILRLARVTFTRPPVG